jgi:hypothetical protein
MSQFCDETKNFVTNKAYDQIVIKDLHNSAVPKPNEEMARSTCLAKTMEGGQFENRDFFYQQHGNGHTICGFFKTKLDDNDTRVKHGHTFGGVCGVPKVPEEPDEQIKNSLDDLKSEISSLKSIMNEIVPNEIVPDEEPCLTSKGWRGGVGQIINFKKNGANGLQQGMTLQDCVNTGKEHGWTAVGHRNSNHGARNHKNTCWRYNNNSNQDITFEDWVKSGGNHRDGAHTSVVIKPGCVV